jgi:hypothetical protein
MATRKKVTSIDKPKRKYVRKAKLAKDHVERKPSLYKIEESKFELFFKALTEYCSEDHLAPGLQLAWLEDKKCWYAAIHRYPRNSMGRQILLKETSSKSAKDAVSKAINKFKGTLAPQKKYIEEFTK